MTEKYIKSFGEEQIQLVNLKERDDWSVYIGRKNSYYDLSESTFSNPYTLDEYGREEAVRLYELWLFKQLLQSEEFFDEFTELRGETLACWCLPESCHGEVLSKAVVAYENDNLYEHLVARFEKLKVSLFGHSEEKKEVEKLLKNPEVDLSFEEETT